jgi:autotransporter-associated beta strand protein
MLGRKNRLAGAFQSKITSKLDRRQRAGVALSAAAMLACAASTQAATLYWNGAGTSWNTVSDWSTASGATTPNPAAVPGSGDIADFNITTVNSTQIITLDANQNASGLIYGSTGIVNINSGTGTNTLTIGSSGITVNSGAGGGIINTGLVVTGTEKWQNNTILATHTPLTISGTITRNVGSLIDFQTPGTGSAGGYTNQGIFATTLANTAYSGSAASIIGGWAVYQINGSNDGNFAVANSSGGVSGLATYYTVAGSTGANGFQGSGGSNITVTGNGTASSALTVNSIHFTGGNTLTSNGGLVIGSGGVILGNVGGNSNTFAGTGTLTSGNGQDLDFTCFSNAASGINMNQVVTDNGSTPIGLTLNSIAGNLKMVLSQANTFSGDTNINGDSTHDSITLTNGLGLQNSTVNYAGGGTLYFGTSTTPITTATVGGLKGSQNLAIANQSNGLASVSVSFGNNGVSTTYSGSLNASSGAAINKIGAGTWTLSGANTLDLAPTNINAGTLSLTGTGGLQNSPKITVASGATFDVSTLTAGAYTLGSAQTLTGVGTVNGNLILPSGAQISPGIGAATSVGTLAVGGLNLASGSIINDYFGTPGTSGSPGTSSLISATNVTLPSSGLKINLFDNANNNGNGTLATGVYDILNFSGTLSGFVAGSGQVGASAGSFTVIGSPLAGRTYTFSQVGSQIDLTVGSGSATLTWTGGTNGNWDTATAGNWLNGSSAATYADPNSAIFPDLAGGASSITVKAGGVSPATVVFSNNSTTYSLSNAGGDTVGINGSTGIAINGSAGVTFAGANSFTGPIAINAGTLTISNGNALGNIGVLSGVTVANGTSLRLQGGITTNAQPLTLNGTGASTGALNNLTGSNTYAGPVTLASPSTVTATAGTLSITGGINTSGNALTVNGSGNVNINTGSITGSGSLTYSGAGKLSLAGSHTYTGGTTLNSGTLNIASSTALGTNTLTFGGNATLQAGASATVTVPVAIGGGVTATIDTQGNSLTTSGISGSSASGLTKIGSGSLTLKGTNSYTGPTTVTNGTLVIGNVLNNATMQVDATRLTGPSVSSVANLGTQGGTFSSSSTAITAGAINGKQALTFNGSAATALLSSNAFTDTGTGITEFVIESAAPAGGYTGEVSYNGPVGGADWTGSSANLATDDGGAGANVDVSRNGVTLVANRPSGGAQPILWDSEYNGSGSLLNLYNSSWWPLLHRQRNLHRQLQHQHDGPGCPTFTHGRQFLHGQYR